VMGRKPFTPGGGGFEEFGRHTDDAPSCWRKNIRYAYR
jgi:hypothetical protein